MSAAAAGEAAPEGAPQAARVLVVVSERGDLPEHADGATLDADRYLAGDEAGERGCVVVNLCRSYRYRTKGYYVSLLADARGQRVVPSVETLEGMAAPFMLFRTLQEAGIPTVDAGARPRRGTLPAVIAPAADAECLAYFGETSDPRFQEAARATFREWPVPVLRLHFVQDDELWRVAQVEPVSLHHLSPTERAPLLEALADPERLCRHGAPEPSEEKRASIAVLVEEGDPFSPSSPETIDRLERVAARENVHVRRITLNDLERLGEYDALFIRALTGVRDPSFQFALRAEALDMPVVDDTQSIIRCSNKVFLEELLGREGIPTPRTLVATARTPWSSVSELGSPVVIKLPDGSFSAAVHKIASEAEYRERSAEMFRRSPLIIAQEYLPTEYDWRITILEGRLLFAAKYHMAPGHWQIRDEQAGTERYGKVEAVRRADAPASVVELALRAAALVGNGLYGVDLKETPAGPVVIEINDNPNLDVGYEDAADGDLIYHDLIQYFLRRIEEGATEPAPAASAERELEPLRQPIARPTPRRPHYRPFEVAGLELEYAVVDRDLNIASRVEPALRVLAGRPTSDVDLGAIGFSNEIADHVFELKTLSPTPSLAVAEEQLVEGVRRFDEVLAERWGARLMPTGMHPWMNPRKGRLWTRSNVKIYQCYARLFDVQTHGWMNVHAAHLNLPFGREDEAVAMHNAAALLIPYLPALSASSPMHDGELQPSEDGRLAWILQHQARIPESMGATVPEYVESFNDYRRRVLRPMYRALDALPDAGVLRHEFFNARGAVLKFSRKSMEIRVIDMQECVKMDVAIAVFARSVLRSLSRQVLTGRLALPEHGLLVEDFHATVRDGSRARVYAPFLPRSAVRGDDGKVPVNQVLMELLSLAERAVRRDETQYLGLVERVIESGSLAEKIRAALLPYADQDDAVFTEAARRVYIELCDCLEANEPWAGRWGGTTI
jgi:glutathione synthase/RimK-type ligase-like ATP-grasp enzyme/gamma-glutamyl:cysteine ligase YbdK (ATP-grasp superfamily)